MPGLIGTQTGNPRLASETGPVRQILPVKAEVTQVATAPIADRPEDYDFDVSGHGAECHFTPYP